MCPANVGAALLCSVSIKEKAQRQNAVTTDQSPCCLCQERFSPMCSFPGYQRYLYLHGARRPQQSGFTADRSTVDAILALRLLSELHREFDCPLHEAYLKSKVGYRYVTPLT